MIMERKIGEIFEHNGEWYQCVKDKLQESCVNCCFYNGGYKKCDDETVGNCLANSRSDGYSVCFKKLEKVGEPMKIHNRLVLKVKADAYKCMRCCFYSKGKCELAMQECEHYDCGEENKFIEIKQNKEDMEDLDKIKVRDYTKVEELNVMEENKLNLKPFDLEAAKSGKPVCTRDGRKARIICFDAKGKQPIIALLEREKTDEEIIQTYSMNGRYYEFRKEDHRDLMMLPEKREGWVNVYRDCDGANITKDDNIYSSKEAAMASAQFIDENSYVATTKINWEE